MCAMYSYVAYVCICDVPRIISLDQIQEKAAPFPKYNFDKGFDNEDRSYDSLDSLIFCGYWQEWNISI